MASTQTPAATAVPPWLMGLWRRRSLVRADGTHDNTTTVYWLQTGSLFGDIRIPADRPSAGTAATLHALPEATLRALARQEGFAGHAALDGDLCYWHREIDFQPDSGVPDAGRLESHGGLLVETGVHATYTEVWERVAEPSDDELACRLVESDHAGSPRNGCLVTTGDYFIFALGRRTPIAPAASLAVALAERHATRAELVHLLDVEISFGRRRGGALPWEIQLSTLPFREGQPLRLANLQLAD